MIIWDGMRPDFISPETTPAVQALAEHGTVFTRNHSVYVTSTEVNGTAMATGCYPSRDGLLANREYRPDLNLVKSIGTEDIAYMRISDALTDGRYLLAPTLAETLQAHGIPTVIAGTKPVALLHDRSLNRETATAKQSVVLYAGATQPQTALASITGVVGEFPPAVSPMLMTSNRSQNEWTTKALTQVLWRDAVPKFSLLWLGDPDLTQHLVGPGAPAALQAIRDCDDNVATVLAALDAKGVRETTDIFLLSDHGFSTVDKTVDVAKLLRENGFNVVRAFRETPHEGEILAVNLGGSMMFYVIGRGSDLIAQLAAFLQKSDFAGPIFTKDRLPGTFGFEDARIDTPNAPDVMFSFAWSAEKNRYGAPGTLISEPVLGRKSGFGTHASLSPFDIHNTLLAAGPDIRQGFRDELPSANVDVAPTILKLLGVNPSSPMDGRVLQEALNGNDIPIPAAGQRMLLSQAMLPNGQIRRQYLQYSTVGSYTYLDEGNVLQAPANGK